MSTWSLKGALPQAVLAATRRMRDHGHHDLADAVLADEGRRLVADAEATAQRLANVFTRPWRDVFGVLRCPRCAGHLEPTVKGITVNPCACRPAGAIERVVA